MGRQIALSGLVSDSRSTILNCCRALGWLLAMALVAAPTLEALDQLHGQGARSVISKRAYMKKVRDCVHGRSGPVRSWETCEVVARDSE